MDHFQNDITADAYKQEILSNVQKLSETTIERRGSRKAVEELSEKRNTLMTAYLGHEDAMLDARHEVETLEFLRDNLKASEKSEEKIAELEKEIEYLRGLLEKSKNPAKRRELGERLEKANDDLEKTRELAKKQRQSRGQAIDDLAAIQERIRKAERSTKQDARRIEKIIERMRRGGAQTEPEGTGTQEMTAEVSAALAEARERLRAVTAEAGNMHAKYSRILAIDKELHKLGKYTVDSALLAAFSRAETVKEAEAVGNDILFYVKKQVPKNPIDQYYAKKYLRNKQTCKSCGSLLKTNERNCLQCGKKQRHFFPQILIISVIAIVVIFLCFPISLSPPMNFSLNEDILSWDKIKHADSYTITLQKIGDTQKTNIYSRKNEFSLEQLSNGIYKIFVVAHSDSFFYKESKKSLTFEIESYTVKKTRPDIVYYAPTGTQVHIKKNCSSFKGSVYSGTLAAVHRTGRTEWCWFCARNMTDQRYYESLTQTYIQYRFVH